MTRPSTEEIREELGLAVDQTLQGGSKWDGMTYEEGVEAALDWVLGEAVDKPMSGDG